MVKHTGITFECAIPMDSSNYIPINKRPPITAQVVIGTPGTINKWMSTKQLGASNVKILVFDEADHMLAEDGFKDDSLRIMKDIQGMSSHCQILLFCAHLVMVIKERIFEFGECLGQTIIFVRTRNSVSTLHRSLVELGYVVTTIQGALNQAYRYKIFKEFKDGLTQVLVSTDLLARGFDQQQVNLVINYDLPVKHDNRMEPGCEVYLHRIGRVGHFGREGAVFNLLCGDADQMFQLCC
ncbi:DEAD-box ATP-dependent RNA helicase 38 [Hibiscus syriacus]|uniref:RNA helicase n=1 Tax=Hibiscus syriacus TaxID=106335 RepID=A0A6A3CWH1_HIBSY|nr:DEAD-box ATP-dependent RNA helicase 38 [Hibiscus syriacus]